MNVIIYDLPRRAEREWDEHIELGAPEDVARDAACRVAAAEEIRRIAGVAKATGSFAVSLDVLRGYANKLDPTGGVR